MQISAGQGPPQCQVACAGGTPLPQPSQHGLSKKKRMAAARQHIIDTLPFKLDAPATDGAAGTLRNKLEASKTRQELADALLEAFGPQACAKAGYFHS